MKHLVLIGDLVGSRQSGERAALQRRLQRAVQAVNLRRQSLLASPMTITLGDEFQAIYRGGGTVFADIFFLLHALAPVRVRFALAVGEIVTPLNRERAIGMDGPAFHQARDLLTELKGDARLLGLAGAKEDIARLAKPVLAVLSGQIEGWREKRLQLMAGLLDDSSSTELAKVAKITPRAVNKNIRAADLDEWKSILSEFSRALDDALKTK
jgi:hypothetical protein